MTKKDYILIADSINRSRMVTDMTEKNQVKKKAKIDAYRLVAHDLAGTLKGDNQAFTQELFIKACGF